MLKLRSLIVYTTFTLVALKFANASETAILSQYILVGKGHRRSNCHLGSQSSSTLFNKNENQRARVKKNSFLQWKTHPPFLVFFLESPVLLAVMTLIVVFSHYSGTMLLPF